MAKVTMATVKSFVRKNQGKILIKTKTRFDGMYDCVMPTEKNDFEPAQKEGFESNTLGIRGAWFVDGGRNLLTPFDKDGIVGFEVYNCCGSFTIGVKK